MLPMLPQSCQSDQRFVAGFLSQRHRPWADCEEIFNYPFMIANYS